MGIAFAVAIVLVWPKPPVHVPVPPAMAEGLKLRSWIAPAPPIQSTIKPPEPDPPPTTAGRITGDLLKSLLLGKQAVDMAGLVPPAKAPEPVVKPVPVQFRWKGPPAVQVRIAGRTISAGHTPVMLKPGGYAYTMSHPCLLYTSPSPRDKRQSRMPSSA